MKKIEKEQRTIDDLKDQWHIGENGQSGLLENLKLDARMQGWVNSLIDNAIDASEAQTAHAIFAELDKILYKTSPP